MANAAKKVGFESGHLDFHHVARKTSSRTTGTGCSFLGAELKGAGIADFAFEFVDFAFVFADFDFAFAVEVLNKKRIPGEYIAAGAANLAVFGNYCCWLQRCCRSGAVFQETLCRR